MGGGEHSGVGTDDTGDYADILRQLTDAMTPLGIEVRISMIQPAKVPHVCLYEGSAQIFQWWPSSGKYFLPITKKRGTEEDVSAIIEAVKQTFGRRDP
jgi:hypothetical protein